MSTVTALNARYVLNRDGNRVEVILSIQEYEALLAGLDGKEDIAAFDSAEAANEPTIPLEQVIDEIEGDAGR